MSQRNKVKKRVAQTIENWEVVAMNLPAFSKVKIAVVLCTAFAIPVTQCQAQTSRESLPFISATEPLTLLSGNDGEIRYLHTSEGLRKSTVPDSLTVIRLSPGDPPETNTVYGTVPVTIHGSPHLAISSDGRFGYVTNHSWRLPFINDEPPLPEAHRRDVLCAIDLEDKALSIIDTVEFEHHPWMVDLHPDGQRVVVGVGRTLAIYGLKGRSFVKYADIETPGDVYSFDVCPATNRLLLVTANLEGAPSGGRMYLYEVNDAKFKYERPIEIPEKFGKADRLFSPRISPNGATALVLGDFGIGGKGTLDDALLVDLVASPPSVIHRIRQLGDGLESLAFHPDGKFAVVCCLGKGPDVATASHLAVIDLTQAQPRILYNLPIDPVPEGIEFSPDGSQLFVGCTLASQIVVYDVVGSMLKRSPFILKTGHGHASLALGRSKSK